MSTSVLIVSPYAASANNGNWRTAARWARLLHPSYRVIVRTPADSLHDADALVALHARRSHAVIRAWRQGPEAGPCVLVLTGTDLYRDIPEKNTAALESLRLADRLIVLQPLAIRALPAAHRHKAAVVYQSAEPLPPFPKSSRRLRALFVGHIRSEKDPLTFVRAAARLDGVSEIDFALAGGVRDPKLARTLDRLRTRAPTLTMLGALSHAGARQRIRRSHLLVVPSSMEGGANVIVEAVMSGTPVLASDCDGNVGMLGEDYPGYFGVGDAQALATLVLRCRDEPAYLRELNRMCAARVRCFRPEAERSALRRILESSFER
ncbi:MAG: TIGR04348 family glycosyltransferase [Betaproteobacteria bacterium]|nr:TIGR04348 family glycosyltransferase [Betaproteobacteria bacterium]